MLPLQKGDADTSESGHEQVCKAGFCKGEEE